MNKTITSILGAIILSMTVMVGIYFLIGSYQVKGSAIDGQGYMATSTDATWLPSAGGSDKLILSGQAQLGSVIITSATTGTLTLVDATTTDITKRNNVPTSTIAIMGASVAAGGAAAVAAEDDSWMDEKEGGKKDSKKHKKKGKKVIKAAT